MPTHRSELTRGEVWRLCWVPRITRALFVAAVFAVVGIPIAEMVAYAFVDVVDRLPWHPWRAHAWLVCYGQRDSFIAVYTQQPRFCTNAPLDCAATCETRIGKTTWDVCEQRCPADRLARVW